MNFIVLQVSFFVVTGRCEFKDKGSILSPEDC